MVSLSLSLSLSLSPDLNPCAMFVRTQYGGHLGFFEGGVVRANAVSWIDRLILQYARACSEILPTCQKS